ncbi:MULTISPECIES: hypothetical protein [unclassified Devosia]|uniref:hypothetical protein n=1 Tax=unclassified Devosia TaxID=196773 RepID=UPI00086EB58B|nr:MULTISPECIES: hypothetical protein [unclassified Devosia]MBN9364835.1 hypothetical protein [Devosia sp.]ODS97720.1 MAG: hypothetical protein ABS47_00510 [Devosia sp. SCN 66-27]OJX25679.1 MAG: hypothetical protein BGO83_12765 [Devosia sp. 66-14]
MLTQTFLPLLTAGLLLVAPVAALAQQPADTDDAALAYSKCMRDNGYAEFPDPTPGEGMRFLVIPGSAARFDKAATACRALAPAGLGEDGVTPEQLDGLLQLAQCVREHGVPSFPDPAADGRFDVSKVSAGPDDPRLKAAMTACRELGRGARIMIGG